MFAEAEVGIYGSLCGTDMALAPCPGVEQEMRGDETRGWKYLMASSSKGPGLGQGLMDPNPDYHVSRVASLFAPLRRSSHLSVLRPSSFSSSQGTYDHPKSSGKSFLPTPV